MKNLKNLLSIKVIQALWLLVFGFVLLGSVGCEVEEIPDADTTSPAFTLTIQGPGVNRTFTERDNFNSLQLNVLKDATYSFTFLGLDAGGVERILLSASFASVDITVPDPEVLVEVDGLRTRVSKAGDVGNPVTGLSMTGLMAVVGNANESFNLSIEVHDFATPANSTFADLALNIVDDPDSAGL